MYQFQKKQELIMVFRAGTIIVNTYTIIIRQRYMKISKLSSFFKKKLISIVHFCQVKDNNSFIVIASINLYLWWFNRTIY